MARIVLCDIWNKHATHNDMFIVLPTNLSVNKNGNAIMGRGLAKQAADKFPKLSTKYGNVLKNDLGTHGVYIFFDTRIIPCPVKKNYKDDADLKIIERSLKLIMDLRDGLKTKIKLLIPMLGCGFGGLMYEQVLPLLLEYCPKGSYIVIPPDNVYGKDKYRESFLPGITDKKDRRVNMSNKFNDIPI